MSWIAVAIGAGVGILKSVAVDAPKAERERKLASETQKYAYLTGNQAAPVHEADPLGSAIQFGSTGAMLHQAGTKAAADETLAKDQSALTRAQTDRLNSGGSVWGGGPSINTPPAQSITPPISGAVGGARSTNNPWQGAWGQPGPVAKSYNPWTF